MGPERRSRVITDKEKRIIAYHEAGHTLVQIKLDQTSQVHKVTIVGRGMAGGYTLALPKDDQTMMTKTDYEADLAGLLGGRVAEEVALDDITSGASSDLRRVTRIARTMVTELAMSEAMGHRTFGQKEELIFLGREISEQRDYSEEIAAQIDREIKAIVDKAYKTCKTIIVENRDKLDAIANLLIEKETVESPELYAIVEGPELPAA